MRILLLLLSLMPLYTHGFNFRTSAGFVADGPNETGVISGDAYPTTRDGVTFGWTSGLDGTADQNAAVDRRLAGIAYNTNDGVQSTFRADLLSAASHAISLALGYAIAQGYQYVQIKDGSTVLLTIDDTNGNPSNTWDDATGTGYSDVTWPSSNTAVPVAFVGTALSLVLGSPAAQVDASCIAHLFISQVPTAAPPRLARIMAPQQRMCA